MGPTPELTSRTQGADSTAISVAKVSAAPAKAPNDRIWLVVLISGFLGLMVDGMDAMFLSYSLPSLMRDLQLSHVQAGSLASYSVVGMALGGFAGGYAADRFGRVRTVVWTILLFSVGTAVLGLTRSYAEFAVVRFISSLGLGAEYIVCNTLMAEYVPTHRRTTILGTLQAGWSVGYVLATLLARAIIPVYGWRWLFAIALAPVVLALLIRQMVPEPPSWRAARELATGSGALTRSGAAQRSAPRQNRWSVIFSNPRYRRIFAMWTLTASFLQFGYFGVSNWLPTYVVQELHFNFITMTSYLVGTYIAMILGKIVAGYLGDVLGRRWMFVAGGLCTAIFLPFIVFLHTPGNIVVLLTVFGFLYGVPFGVNATYLTESFETQIRGTAIGGAYNLGRIGSAMAPLIIGVLATHHSIGLGLIVMGGAYFLAGIIPALFIPEKMYDPQRLV